MKRNFYTFSIYSNKLIIFLFFLSFFPAQAFSHDSSSVAVTRKQAEEARKLLEKSKTYVYYCSEFAASSNNTEAAEIGITGVKIEKDTTPKPDKKLSLTEILTGLNTQGKTKEIQNLAERNGFITRRIYQMGVNFPLTKENEQALRKEGAKDDLIMAIQIAADPWVIKIDRRLHPADTYVKVGNTWTNLAALLNIYVNNVPKELPQNLTVKKV